ncbi:nucleotidyltransferase family protein [Candidatus Parcubacteria bacterium]|nr:nucleotidyltransferase family protein [Candidatus Parcubacteria bacterium]
MNLEKVKKIITKNESFVSEKYGAVKFGVFGSVARGEQSKNSDIDMLVEFNKPIGLFKFVELKQFLENEMGTKVDLVTKKALKPLIKNDILNQTIYI